MATYTPDTVLVSGKGYALEPQQQLADGRWTPIGRVVALSPDGGWAETLEVDGAGQLISGPGGEPVRRRVQGSFRVVCTKTGEVNPAIAQPTTAPSSPESTTVPTIEEAAADFARAETEHQAEATTAAAPVQSEGQHPSE